MAETDTRTENSRLYAGAINGRIAGLSAGAIEGGGPAPDSIGIRLTTNDPDALDRLRAALIGAGLKKSVGGDYDITPIRGRPGEYTLNVDLLDIPRGNDARATQLGDIERAAAGMAGQDISQVRAMIQRHREERRDPPVTLNEYRIALNRAVEPSGAAFAVTAGKLVARGLDATQTASVRRVRDAGLIDGEIRIESNGHGTSTMTVDTSKIRGGLRASHIKAVSDNGREFQHAIEGTEALSAAPGIESAVLADARAAVTRPDSSGPSTVEPPPPPRRAGRIV